MSTSAAHIWHISSYHNIMNIWSKLWQKVNTIGEHILHNSSYHNIMKIWHTLWQKMSITGAYVWLLNTKSVTHISWNMTYFVVSVQKMHTYGKIYKWLEKMCYKKKRNEFPSKKCAQMKKYERLEKNLRPKT